MFIRPVGLAADKASSWLEALQTHRDASHTRARSYHIRLHREIQCYPNLVIIIKSTVNNIARWSPIKIVNDRLCNVYCTAFPSQWSFFLVLMKNKILNLKFSILRKLLSVDKVHCEKRKFNVLPWQTGNRTNKYNTICRCMWVKFKLTTHFYLLRLHYWKVVLPPTLSGVPV